MSDRFTAWFSDEERVKLRALSVEHHCSQNFIVRMAVRALLFGKPIPSYLQQQDQRVSSK